MEWLFIGLVLVGAAVNYGGDLVRLLSGGGGSAKAEKNFLANKPKMRELLAAESVTDGLSPWSALPELFIAYRETRDDVELVIRAREMLWNDASIAPKFVGYEEMGRNPNHPFEHLYQWRLPKPEHNIWLQEPARVLLTALFPARIDSYGIVCSLRPIMVHTTDVAEVRQQLAHRLQTLRTLLSLITAEEDVPLRLLNMCTTDDDALFRVEACRQALHLCHEGPTPHRHFFPVLPLADRVRCLHQRFGLAVSLSDNEEPTTKRGLLTTVVGPLIARYQPASLERYQGAAASEDQWTASVHGANIPVNLETVLFCAVLFPECLNTRETARFLAAADNDRLDFILAVLHHLSTSQQAEALSKALLNPVLRPTILGEFFTQHARRYPILIQTFQACPDGKTRLSLLSFIYRTSIYPKRDFVVNTIDDLVSAEVPLSLRDEMVTICLRILADSGTMDDLPRVQLARDYCFTEDALIAHKQAVNAIAKRGNLQHEGLLSVIDGGEQGGALTRADGGGGLTRLDEAQPQQPDGAL